MEKQPKLTYKKKNASFYFENLDFLRSSHTANSHASASPSIDSHHGFDLSERSVLTDTGMLHGERRQRRGPQNRPSIDPASAEYEAAAGRQMPANQCWPTISCSQSIHPASLPGSNDFQAFVWRRKCRAEMWERDAGSVKPRDERIKLVVRISRF